MGAARTVCVIIITSRVDSLHFLSLCSGLGNVRTGGAKAIVCAYVSFSCLIGSFTVSFAASAFPGSGQRSRLCPSLRQIPHSLTIFYLIRLVKKRASIFVDFRFLGLCIIRRDILCNTGLFLTHSRIPCIGNLLPANLIIFNSISNRYKTVSV